MLGEAMSYRIVFRNRSTECPTYISHARERQTYPFCQTRPNRHVLPKISNKPSSFMSWTLSDAPFVRDGRKFADATQIPSLCDAAKRFINVEVNIEGAPSWLEATFAEKWVFFWLVPLESSATACNLLDADLGGFRSLTALI